MSFLSLVITRAPLDGAFVPKRKFNGAIGAAVLEKGIDQTNAMINMGLSSYLSHQSSKSLMEKQQNWIEAMYNKYQSPEALMRQYREANINPYLGSGAVGSGSMPSAPSSPGQSTPPLAAGASGNMAAVAQVDSQIQSQEAQAYVSLVNGISQAVKDFGVEGAIRFCEVTLPRFKGVINNNMNIVKLASNQLEISAAQKDILNVTAFWEKKYGVQFRSDQMMKVEQEIDQIVANIGLMSSSADLNRAKIDEVKQNIKESFSRIARNYAEALKLKEEAGVYHISADTAQKIQSHILDQFILQNGCLGLNLLRGNVQYGIEEAGAAIKRKQASDPVLQGVKFGLETLGNVFHVSGGFNWSNVNGVMNSWNHNNSPSLYSGDGYHLQNGVLLKDNW